MTWDDVIPSRVALAQKAYERQQSMLRAVNAGATQAEIARFLNLSHTTIALNLCKARRAKSPPITVWLKEREEISPSVTAAFKRRHLASKRA